MRTKIAISLIAVIAAATLVFAARPAAAFHARSVDPTTLDPNLLAPSANVLPAGAIVDHQGVSDNADADGKTTPPDGFKSQLAILHQTPYETLGRINGYRLDFHFTISGTPAGTEYLASIFPDSAHAQAAMQDAIGPGSLIQIIGQPLTNPCTAGDKCAAYSGPNPGTTNKAVVGIFYRGAILIETATQVPAANFSTLEPSLEQALYGFLNASDAQVQTILSAGNPPSPPPATATPIATATTTTAPVSLTVSLSIAHSKVKAGKKEAISVSTLPAASVDITVTFPNKSKKAHDGTADSSGDSSWTFKQPKGKTKGSNHTAKVAVVVTDASGQTAKASGRYKIG